MWRPDDWDEIKKDAQGHAPPMSTLAFEAGADAMLEGLKESGVTLSNYNPVNRTVMETASFLNQCKDGWLVFIPDEGNDNKT